MSLIFITALRTLSSFFKSLIYSNCSVFSTSLNLLPGVVGERVVGAGVVGERVVGERVVGAGVVGGTSAG